MIKCQDCRYWSEMLAKADDGPVMAVCLCQQSKNKRQYTSGRNGCERGKESVFGAIDQPSHDPEGIRRAYEQYDAAGVP